MRDIQGIIPGPSEAQHIIYRLHDEGSHERGEWLDLNSPVNADLLLRKFLPSGEEWERLLGSDETAPDHAAERINRTRLERWKEIANGTHQCPGRHVFQRHERGAVGPELRTTQRLIVGVGTATVYGIGLTVHPLYGIPIIPGSSVKGIARGAVEPEIESTDTIASLWAWLHDNGTPTPAGLTPFLGERADGFVTELFGSSEIGGPDGALAGAVVFQDAWPKAERDWYELDVVTPHYGRYHGGNLPSAPDDRESPVPVVFPVVRSGVSFRFPLRLAPRGRTATADRQKAYLMLAEAIVRYALTHRGAGAKTRVGYGYFA